MTGERIPSGTSTIARLFPVKITDIDLDGTSLRRGPCGIPLKRELSVIGIEQAAPTCWVLRGFDDHNIL